MATAKSKKTASNAVKQNTKKKTNGSSTKKTPITSRNKSPAKKTTSAAKPAKGKTPAKATAAKSSPKAKTTAKKSTVSPTASKKATQKTTTAKKNEFILRKTGLDKDGNQKFTAVKVYDKMPKGWKETTGAITAPVGYKWINNGKSVMSGERRSAFIKDSK